MIDRNRQAAGERRETALRIGAVSYLNSKPLIEGLAESVPEASILLDYPSRLAEALVRGALDVALVPSIMSISDPGCEVVPDACVASRGPVLSVKLYFRTMPGSVRTLALDEGSRTSAALARIMLAERYGVEPRIEALPMEAGTTGTAADAILLIGDRAIEPPGEEFREVWDLGEEWLRWTGYPFVFALWVARREVPLPHIETALNDARDRGVKNLSAIVARESAAMGLPRPVVDNYLRRNLHFTLGPAERQGLRLYLELAAQLGLAPSGRMVTYRDVARRNRAGSVPLSLAERHNGDVYARR